MEDAYLVRDDGEASSPSSSSSPSTSSSAYFATKVAVLGSVGGFLFGYDLGVVSGALPMIANEFTLSLEEQSIFVGSLSLGSLLGSIIGGSICDWCGRIKGIHLCCLLFTAGALIIATSESLPVLCVGRFVAGVGVSMSAIVDVSYLTEVSAPEYRGTVTSCNELMVTVGLLAAYVMNTVLDDYPGSWRWMFGIPAPISLVWAISIFFMPESPKWLLIKGKNNLAIDVFRMIYTNDDRARIEFDSSLKHLNINYLENAQISWDLLRKWQFQIFLVW